MRKVYGKSIFYLEMTIYLVLQASNGFSQSLKLRGNQIGFRASRTRYQDPGSHRWCRAGGYDGGAAARAAGCSFGSD
jgi:hypothetical protein